MSDKKYSEEDLKKAFEAGEKRGLYMGGIRSMISNFPEGINEPPKYEHDFKDWLWHVFLQ